MSVPDFLPVLSAGAHPSPRNGSCVMEYASILAGEAFSDHPACTHPVLASAARTVNDRLDQDHRQQLLPLIPRLMGTTDDRAALSVQLAVWSARQVLDLAWPEHQGVCENAIRTAQLWLDGKATRDEAREVACATDLNAWDTAVGQAAAYVAYAASALCEADSVTYSATAAAEAVEAISCAHFCGDFLVGFLAGLLDEYDRLTGRVETGTLSDYQLRILAAATS